DVDRDGGAIESLGEDGAAVADAAGDDGARLLRRAVHTVRRGAVAGLRGGRGQEGRDREHRCQGGAEAAHGGTHAATASAGASTGLATRVALRASLTSCATAVAGSGPAASA